MNSQSNLQNEAIDAYREYRSNQGNPIENEVIRYEVQADRDSVKILSGPNDGELIAVAIYRDGKIVEVGVE